jgi:hypothetical protein
MHLEQHQKHSKEKSIAVYEWKLDNSEASRRKVTKQSRVEKLVQSFVCKVFELELEHTKIVLHVIISYLNVPK